MKEFKKKYAVFIPCFNAAATIKDTIDSVLGAIAHLGTAIPVFIYDDHSSDNSVSICSELIRPHENFQLVVNVQNAGERRTTNDAFARLLGRFDWCFIIHADDIAKKNWLSVLIEQIEIADNLACFTVWSSFDTLDSGDGSVRSGDNSGTVQKVVKDRVRIRQYLTKITSSWHLSGAALNVHLYGQLNGFNENMPQLGDTDFYVRGLLAGYSDIYIALSLTQYRISGSSVTSNSYRSNRDLNEIYMLVNNHRQVLTGEDLLTMYAMARKMSVRRMLKWTVNLKPGLALAGFNQFIKSIKSTIQVKKGTQA